MDNAEVLKRLQKIKEEKNLTQSQIAKRMGVSDATVSYVFNGNVNITENFASRFAECYCNGDVLYLIYGISSDLPANYLKRLFWGLNPKEQEILRGVLMSGADGFREMK